MMLGLHGRESDVQVFHYVLAEKLGKTIGEIGMMPHAELVAWSAYLKAKDAIQNKRKV